MEKKLHGKVALVTGAGGLIGRDTVRRLAEAGAGVAAADIVISDELNGLVREIAAGGGKAVVEKLDITDSREAASVFQDVERRLGPVDILVNNAGVVRGKSEAFHRTAEEYWKRLIEVNLFGTSFSGTSFHSCIPASSPSRLMYAVTSSPSSSDAVSRYRRFPAASIAGLRSHPSPVSVSTHFLVQVSSFEYCLTLAPMDRGDWMNRALPVQTFVRYQYFPVSSRWSLHLWEFAPVSVHIRTSAPSEREELLTDRLLSGSEYGTIL